MLGIRQRYSERHERPVPVGHCPWGRDAAVLMLMAACRDVLVDMALGAAIR